MGIVKKEIKANQWSREWLGWDIESIRCLKKTSWKDAISNRDSYDRSSYNWTITKQTKKSEYKARVFKSNWQVIKEVGDKDDQKVGWEAEEGMLHCIDFYPNIPINSLSIKP